MAKNIIEKFLKNRNKMSKLRRTITCLAAVVVFATTYALILPAMTLDGSDAQKTPGIDTKTEINVEKFGQSLGGDQDSGSDVADNAAQAVNSEEKDVSGGEGALQSEGNGEEAPEAAMNSEGEKANGSDSKVGSDNKANDVKDGAKKDTAGSKDSKTADDNKDKKGGSKELSLITEKTEIKFDGKGYKVIAEVGADAKLPADTKLKVREIKKDTRDENGEKYDYDVYCDEALKAVRNKDGEEAKDETREVMLFDISFDSATVEKAKAVGSDADEEAAKDAKAVLDKVVLDKDGNLEPAADVKVKIVFDEAMETSDKGYARAVHFDKRLENMTEEEIDQVRKDVFDTKTEGDKNDELKEASFKSDRFSVYGLVYTAKASGSVLTAKGDNYTITVTVDDAAQIPEGAVLYAKEIEHGTDEYNQYFGNLWSEENKEYFEVEKKREKYDESMGELPEAHYVNIDAARFFEIAVMDGDKKVELKAPAAVEISYDKGLCAAKGSRAGAVSYVSEKKTDILKDVDATVSDKEAKFFKYELESSSKDGSYYAGTYVARDTDDIMVKPDLASGQAAGGSSHQSDINLSDDDIENIIASAEKPAKKSRFLKAKRTAEQPSSNDDSALDKPVGSKTLTSNNDGTYTLSLSVKGHSKVSSDTVRNKSNILFVMDRSSSMITKFVGDESMRWYYGTRNTSSWRNDINEGTGYHFIGVVDGHDVDLNVDFNGSWDNPTISYQTGTNPWGWPVFSPYPNDAPIYVVSKKTRMTAEQEALSNLFGKLLNKNDATGDGTDNIELKVISFGDQRFDKKSWRGETESGWTGGTNADSLISAASSNRYTSGTNWEEALQYADEVISAKKASDGDDEDYYVVFLTDGEPTAVNGDTGPNHTGSEAYNAAKDDAKKLVDKGIKFYNIFTYRQNEDVTYSYYLTNYAYGNGDNNDSTDTEAVQDYFSDARTPEDVINALNNILETIENAIGHANVSITDTLTTDAMTTTIVHGKTNGYIYEVKGGDGTVLYTVTATGDIASPEVVFNVPASSQKDYTAEKSTVGGKTVYTVTTVEGETYKMALADIDDQTGELVWDLAPVGMLMDNCTYSVKFVVWPDQDAYDYVAALNNGLEGYDWNKEAPTYEDLTSTKGYEKGGVEGFPSIVKYPNGTFAVLTNTDQKLHYSVVETETVNGVAGEPVVHGPYYSDLPLPKPMPLKASASQIEKVWNVERDPAVMAELLYDHNGESKEYKIDFEILQDRNLVPYTTVSLGWDSEKNKYLWDQSSEQTVQYNGHKCKVGTRWSSDYSIATGLMLSKERMDALKLDKTAYPSGTFKGKKYYVLETGHDYTIKEPGLTFEFDFSAPLYHPMLVDGVLQNVNFTMDGDGVSITEMTSEENGLSALKIENTLRGYINLNKVVVDQSGQVDRSDKTKFTYTIELENQSGPFAGDHIPWYGINGLFYHDEDYNYYQAVPTESGHLRLTTESGETYDATCSGVFDPNIVGPTEVTFNGKSIHLFGNQTTASSDKKRASTNLKISQGETLSIANVPVGTTYTITEADQAGYNFVKIIREIKSSEAAAQAESSDTVKGTQTITGTIVSNRDNQITYYNKSLISDITVQKVDDKGQGLEGAVFELKKLNGDGHSETPAADLGSVKGLNSITKTVDGNEVTFASAFESTGGVQKISGLLDGTYRLREVYVPAGYIRTYDYIQFTIENRTIKNVTTDTGDTSKLDTTADNVDIKITNEPGAALPNSGGPGTRWMYILGSLLTLGAGMSIVVRRRMSV